MNIFITAEIGVNWIGDLKVLEYLLQSCKRMGVDAVKFQCLSDKLIKRHTELPYYRDASISENNIKEVNELCKKYDMEWYCTVTEPSQVHLLNPYVNKFKIRRADSTNKLLKNECFETGKTVLVSSHLPQNTDAARVISLYCPKKYPLEYNEINFEMIKRMDGFSNHCQNALAIFRAVEFGASFIEVHLTPSKDLFLLDNPLSFTVNELNEIVKWIRFYTKYSESIVSCDSVSSPQSQV